MAEERLNPLTWLQGKFASLVHTHTKSDITDLGTIPSASSTTPSADTSSGAVGTGTTYARADHKHPKSTIYAESSHTHTYSNISNVSVVTVNVTYSDQTTGTIKLLQYTGS